MMDTKQTLNDLAALVATRDGGHLGTFEAECVARLAEAVPQLCERWDVTASLGSERQGLIPMLLVCEVPFVEIDGVPAYVERFQPLPAVPRVGDLIATDHGRTPEPDSTEPGVEVVGVVFSFADGVTVFCKHVGGDWLSALDLINDDGWTVGAGDDEDEAAYREACEDLRRRGECTPREVR